ncbi:MAG: AI-2E family transporter [Oscillospiraceae bacterium]
MGLTFLLLTIGFLILQVEFPLLLGALIALVDALPMLGTGTILVPWGLLVLLQGQTALGLGLIALYGVTALTRSILEPRMVGHQLGLNPLLTLVALYMGYRLWGILGMILAPVLTITVLEIWSMLHSRKEAIEFSEKSRYNEEKLLGECHGIGAHCRAVRPPVQFSQGRAEHVHRPHEPAEMDGRPPGQWTTCPDQHASHAGGPDHCIAGRPGTRIPGGGHAPGDPVRRPGSFGGGQAARDADPPLPPPDDGNPGQRSPGVLPQNRPSLRLPSSHPAGPGLPAGLVLLAKNAHVHRLLNDIHAEGSFTKSIMAWYTARHRSRRAP